MEISSVAAFLDYYKRIRSRTWKVIRTIPPEQLEWTFRNGKFTLGDQVRHIAAIERYMFAETIAGRLSSYLGCGKDLANGYEDVLQYFETLQGESMQIFSALTDSDLQRKCVTPGNNIIPVWKWLRAMVEHEIHHRAQIYIYLSMFGVPTPPIFGLTAEEVAEYSKAATSDSKPPSQI